MIPSLIADVNIALPVIRFLRRQEVDVVSALEEKWGTLSDSEILSLANKAERFVLTHDSDFGMLAIRRGEPAAGIIYLRPGGRPASEVIDDIGDLLNADIDWSPPLIAVYRAKRLRLRRLPN